MKLSNDELLTLKTKLESRKEEVIESELQKLNTSFRGFCSTYNTLYKTMCDEKIIKKDPYGSENKLETLDLPDESQIPYNEEEYAMSIRLGHFYCLLNHIKENIIFSIDFLTPLKIAKLFNIGTFINWDRIFHPQPEGINTEGLNKLLFTYQKDINNNFVLSTLKSTAGHIHNYSQEFLLLLSDIKLFNIEIQKLWIRENILPNIKLPPTLNGENKEKGFDLIYEQAKKLNYKLESTIINAVIQEDFTEDGYIVRSERINSVLNIGKNDNSKEELKNKKQTKENILQETLTEITKIIYQLNSLVEKIEENSTLYRESTYGIIDMIIDYFKYHIFKNKRETIYNVKIKDALSNKLVEKELKLESFIDKIKSYNNKLDKYLDSSSIEYREIFSESSENISKELHNLLSSANYIYKTANALDSFFKLDIDEPRGIQIELKAIKINHDKGQSLYNDFINLNSES